MATARAPAPQVKCPRCGRLQVYSLQNPYRPFCSPQCKTIDLGAWASDSYRIAGQEGMPNAEDLGQGEPSGSVGNLPS